MGGIVDETYFEGIKSFFSLSLAIILTACDFSFITSPSTSSSSDDSSSSSSGSTANTDNSFTVTWVNYDDTVLEIDENVEYGTVPHYDGEIPTRSRDPFYSYEFVGWSPEI